MFPNLLESLEQLRPSGPLAELQACIHHGLLEPCNVQSTIADLLRDPHDMVRALGLWGQSIEAQPEDGRLQFWAAWTGLRGAAYGYGPIAQLREPISGQIAKAAELGELPANVARLRAELAFLDPEDVTTLQIGGFTAGREPVVERAIFEMTGCEPEMVRELVFQHTEAAEALVLARSPGEVEALLVKADGRGDPLHVFRDDLGIAKSAQKLGILQERRELSGGSWAPLTWNIDGSVEPHREGELAELVLEALFEVLGDPRMTLTSTFEELGLDEPRLDFLLMRLEKTFDLTEEFIEQLFELTTVPELIEAARQIKTL